MATKDGSLRSKSRPQPKKGTHDKESSARDSNAHPPVEVTSSTLAIYEQQLDRCCNEDDNSKMFLKIKSKESFLGHQIPGANAHATPLTETTSHASTATQPDKPFKNKQKIVLSARSAKLLAGPLADTFTTEQPATTKSGRKSVARKVQNDTVQGVEYEAYLGMRMPDEENPQDGDYVPSSPVIGREPTKSVGRLSTSHRTPLEPTEEVASPSSILENEEEEDALTCALSQGFRDINQQDKAGHSHSFFADIDQQIHNTVADLAAWEETLINLPTSTEGVWTARELTHMYISAYSSKHWHICDLIADTWIRAFQDLNKSEGYIWRPNKNNWVYKAKNAENFGLDDMDPPLDSQMCAFEAELLNNLYHHTDKDCGARMLWADSMALCGAEWEEELTGPKRRRNKWHPDIFYNVMCTALRMVRRKLTLKIEESTEGAWCKRYHMHSVHSMPCYRRLARDEMRRASKRRAEEMDGGDGGDNRPTKRVSFADSYDDSRMNVSEED